jgi:excisionase family DNA binding protein
MSHPRNDITIVRRFVHNMASDRLSRKEAIRIFTDGCSYLHGERSGTSLREEGPVRIAEYEKPFESAIGTLISKEFTVLDDNRSDVIKTVREHTGSEAHLLDVYTDGVESTTRAYENRGYVRINIEQLMACSVSSSDVDAPDKYNVQLAKTEQGRKLINVCEGEEIMTSDQLKDDSLRHYFIKDKGIVTSWGRLLKLEPDYAYIAGMSTLKEYRRQGRATAILQRMLSDAESEQIRHCVLMASSAGAPLYQKMGFERISYLVIFAEQGEAKMAEKDREKDDQIESKEESEQEPAGSGADAGGPAEDSGEIIDMKEAISLLNTTRSTFYRWVREGKIKGMKVGRQWRFYREDIERFLNGQEPRIDLPADIGPLISNLRERAQQLGAKETRPPDTPEVVEAVNLMIHTAAKMNTSDIHLASHIREDSGEKVAMLRYRVDGVLNQIAEIDIRLLPAIIEQWKSMATCDVLEKEKPQDGRASAEIEGEKLDLRVCFLPTGLGESLTVRILDPRAAWLAQLKFDDLGFAPQDRDRISRWVEAPWGMIVVTGPTGSGKTTVLYACLNHVARPEIKVLTVEDPVEVFLPWTVQVPVRPAAGVTFSSALRSVFRSDPDVIMVGEIRDRETLHLAQQCALTGHLVMTVMHAGDSVGVLKRMVEMGSHPYIVGESVRLIIAQRLVRKLCTDCSMEQSSPANLLDQAEEMARAGGLDWDSLPKKFREPVGCAKCNQRGYRGRTVVAETLEVTPEIAAAFRNGASDEELRTIAVEQGMTTMAADGVRKAAMGITSLAEVMRILPSVI